jgi:hypothetical protein
MTTNVVFLSHQSSDKDIVRIVGQYLAEEEIEPILDEWSFRKGRSLSKEIELGIGRSTAFVLFWSEAAASSKYVQFEDEMAVAKRIKDDSYLVHLIRLDETPLPERHSFILWHDWRRGKPGSKMFMKHLDSLKRALLGLPEKPPPLFKNTNDEIKRLLDEEKSTRFHLNLAWQELENWRKHSPHMREQIGIFEEDIRQYETRLKEIRAKLRKLNYSELT